MKQYKIVNVNQIKNTQTGAVFPQIDSLPEYEEYKVWLAAGNTPSPEFTDAEILENTRRSMILTRTQFFLQLKASGHFSAIKTLFVGKPDDDTQRIRFENAATFERLDSDVIAIATTELGMDDAAMDAFFEAGVLL